MGVDGGDDVEQAGDHDEFGAIVGDGDLDGGVAEVQHAGEDVERACAEVAGEAEHVQRVAGIGGVDLALKRDADGEHGDDGDEEQRGTDGLLEQQVAEAGDEPSGEECDGGRDAGFVFDECFVGLAHLGSCRGCGLGVGGHTTPII